MAGAISSATSSTTSCTPTASVSALASASTWWMVTSRPGPWSASRVACSASATARAREIRTLSPLVPGYSRKDSQSLGGLSATNDVTCWLIRAARYRSSYAGSLSHGTDAHSWVPSRPLTGMPSSSAVAALAKVIRPCRSSAHIPYGSRATIRAASTVPSVPATVVVDGADRSGSGRTGRPSSSARRSRIASRSQAEVSCSRSRSLSSGGWEPGQVRKTAP